MTHGATSTAALAAVVFSLVAVGMSVWSIWLEPARLKAQIELAEANREAAASTSDLARRMGQLTEWLSREKAREAAQKAVTEKIYELEQRLKRIDGATD